MIQRLSVVYYCPHPTPTWQTKEIACIIKSDLTLKNHIRQYIDNTLVNGDSLYYTKFSNIPRRKLEAYFESKKLFVNKTTKIERANGIVLNVEDFETFLNYKSHVTYYKIPKNSRLEKAIVHAKATLIDDSYYIGWNNYSPNMLQSSEFEQVELHTTSYSYRTKKPKGDINNFVNTYNIIKQKIDSGEPFKIIEDKMFMNEMGSLLGNTIDDTAYNSLHDMLSSSNADDVRLAMQILANSNINESRLRVLFLMNEFKSKFKDSSIQNVNTKALICHFKDAKWDEGEFGKFIAKQKPNNEEEKGIIELAVKNYINSAWGEHNFIKNIEI